MLLGVMFALVAAGIVVTGAVLLRAHQTKTETNFRTRGQASQFARAGLIEALGWFRKQSAQPVLAFQPRLDLTVTPPITETVEPDIGLVREFQISGSVWGRYEIWKEWDADPDANRLIWRRRMQVRDVSVARGAAGAGNVWLVKSIAHVFRRQDATKLYNEAPNHVLGTAVMETELRRLTLVPPGMAAVCIGTPTGSQVNSKVNIQGALGAAVFFRSGSGTPSVTGGAITVGGVVGSSSYDDATQAVFGVAEDELRGLADDRITQAAAFPPTLPARSLYHVQVPTLDFTSTRRLEGNGIVYVSGNVNFLAGSTSFFTGLLFVRGNVTMRETLEFNGTLICTGTANITGSADWINITYDDNALNMLRTEIGQYRLSGAIRNLQGED
jgi:hypothetical protein